MANDAEMNIGITADASGAISAYDQFTASNHRLSSAMRETVASGSSGFVSMTGATYGATKAVENFNRAARNPVEHAGIYLFSRQMLDFVGLGQLAQHAFMAIDMGVRGVADAFSLSASVVAPVLLALGVGITIFEEMSKKTRASTKELEAFQKSQEADIKVIDDYVAAGGRMSKSLQDVAKDTRAAIKETISGIEANNQAKLAHDKMMLAQLNAVATQKVTNTITGESVLAYGDQTKKIKELTDSIHTETEEITANQHGYATWEDYRRSQTEGLKKQRKEQHKSAEETKRAFEEQIKSLDKFSTEGDRAATEYEGAMRKMTEAAASFGAQTKDQKIDASANKEALNLGAEYDKAMSAANGSHQKMLAAEAAYQNAMVSLDKQTTEKHIENFNHIEQAASSAFQNTATLVGRDFGVMISRGKSMKEAFANIWKDMEAQFISMVTTMMIKWAAFEALTGGLGASSGFASAFTGFKPAAVGFDGVVSRPTFFQAGEGGVPEEVHIGPVGGTSGGSSAGGGGGTVINVSAPITISGVQDVNAIVSLIGQKLAQAIRGQGQLNLVRS